MPNKPGGGGKSQAYDTQDGRYVSGGGSGSKKPSSFSNSKKEKATISSSSNTYKENKKKMKREDLYLEDKKNASRYAKEAGYDDPIVQELFKSMEENRKNQTINNNSKERQDMRMEWIQEETNKQYGARKIRNEKRAVIILGIPAAGKSQITRPILDKIGALEIDADIFKEEYIPESKNSSDGSHTTSAHEESSELAKTMKSQALKNGANLVIPKVGDKQASIERVFDELEKAGYEITLIHNDISLKESMKRNMGRFKNAKENGKSPRLVPLDIILKAYGKTYKTYQALKNRASRYAEYDNDVERGEAPILLESSLGYDLDK